MALALGLPTYLLVTHIHNGQLIDSRASELQSLANSAAAVLSQSLQERSREIVLLAQSPLYSRAALDHADLKTSIERVQSTYPIYSWIGVADVDGTVRAATQDLLISKNVAQRPWFQQARTKSFVGDVHEAKLLAALLKPEPNEGPLRFIDFSAPIKDEHGVIRGVLGAHASWRWAKEVIGAIMPNDAKRTGTEIFIVNGLHQIIYPTGLPADERNVPVISRADKASFVDWGGKEQYLTTLSEVKTPDNSEPLGWRVYVRQPRGLVLADVAALQKSILLVIVCAAGGFVALAWWAGKRLSKPIRQLAAAAEAVAQDQEHHFQTQAPTIELQQLQQALNSMAGSLLKQKHDLEKAVEARTSELLRANQTLEALARRDTLTGVPNRLAANEWLASQFKLLKRHGVSYAVLGIDIDFFKKVNDMHGHAIGDKVLRRVAEILAKSVRETDLVARMGGEEFLVILIMTNLADAHQVAEKIRLSVESALIPPVEQVTLSIGLTMASTEDTNSEAALNRADALLYEAKRSGRNRVVSDSASPMNKITA